MQFLGREGAMYAFFGKRRSYEDEVEKRTLRIEFARKAVEIPTVEQCPSSAKGSVSFFTFRFADCPKY